MAYRVFEDTTPYTPPAPRQVSAVSGGMPAPTAPAQDFVSPEDNAYSGYTPPPVAAPSSSTWAWQDAQVPTESTLGSPGGWVGGTGQAPAFLGNVNDLGYHGGLYKDAGGQYYVDGHPANITDAMANSMLGGFQTAARQEIASNNSSLLGKINQIGDRLGPMLPLAVVGGGALIDGLGAAAAPSSLVTPESASSLAVGAQGASLAPGTTTLSGALDAAAGNAIGASVVPGSTAGFAANPAFMNAISAAGGAAAGAGPLTQLASNAGTTDVPVQWDTAPPTDVSAPPPSTPPDGMPEGWSGPDSGITTDPSLLTQAPAPVTDAVISKVTPVDLVGQAKNLWGYTKDAAGVATLLKAAGLGGNALTAAMRAITGQGTAPSAIRGALSLLGAGSIASLMNAKPAAAPTAHPGGLSAAGTLGTGAWSGPRPQSAARFGFAEGGEVNAQPLHASSGDFIHYLLDHAIGHEDMLDRWARTHDIGNPATKSLTQTAMDAIAAHKADLENMARGGSMAAKKQRFFGLLRGGTGGQDDAIPAALSDGEYVLDADTVSNLGDGNNAAGAEKLDAFRNNIRAHKRSGPLSSIPPKAKPIAKYLPKGK